MPRGEHAHGFSRRHRFTAQGSFGPVLRSGRKIRGDAMVIHAVRGSPGSSRLGVALARRLEPSAVERNRMKRILREAFRRHPVKLAGLDCVVTFRRALQPAEKAGLRGEAERLLDELQRMEAR
jgi:ribonuclease P protein component